ncbi:DUF192 domain-containing protein [Victivallis vadensis]|uniref:DUF192 domain-containing protein n=1 Tax=Victivallis vadensis TaxID=172901 RepID=A0A848AZT4_9BACT|nr:DUF192 domain-containing protein [Victivallis vadensis]NMD88748.1 DUF192 domain-containing protein [Victivallis vadensis]
MMIYDLDSKRYLARHPRWALGWFDRLRGMIGRRFAAGEFDAMVFPRCGAVHSWWMTVPIDLVFLDRESKVVRLKSDFRPWRLPAGCRGAVTVIELPAGAIERAACRVGHRINLNSTLDGEAIEKLQSETILKNAGASPCSAEPGTGTGTNKGFR